MSSSKDGEDFLEQIRSMGVKDFLERVCSIDVEEFREQIRREIEEETRTSRYRQHVRGRSHGRPRGERVHPTQHHVDAVLDFAFWRRGRHPETYDLIRRVHRTVDPPALRRLVEIVLTGGASNASVRRSCTQVIAMCEVFAELDALVEMLKALREMSENEEEDSDD